MKNLSSQKIVLSSIVFSLIFVSFSWAGEHKASKPSPDEVLNMLKEGKIKVIGAMYDVGTGKVDWLPSTDVDEILKKVEASPDKIVEPYAEKAH